MPVHLTGRICDMKFLKKISKRYKIPIIEDAAQSIGSKYFGKTDAIITHSSNPEKNILISKNIKSVCTDMSQLK